ncbi:MAG: hypothetical protein ABI364_02970 [Caldimonas sp.]
MPTPAFTSTTSLRTTNRRIFAAGDVCLEHQYTDSAHASARIVVQNALFLGRRKVSALTIPWCTYTDPEIAHVGIYVKQARERGIPVKTFTVPMHDNDRAIADGEEDGFVKIHVREGTDEILGATIVARHAWRNDQRHLAGDVRRHRPVHGRARDPHLSEAGRSDPASRHRLHALAADALRRLGTAQMGRSLSALVAHAGKHQPPTTESTHDLRAALQRRVLDLPAVLERAGTKAAVF